MKFYYYKTLNQFNLDKSTLLPEDIVFIQETKQIYTHNTFFVTSVENSDFKFFVYNTKEAFLNANKTGAGLLVTTNDKLLHYFNNRDVVTFTDKVLTVNGISPNTSGNILLPWESLKEQGNTGKTLKEVIDDIYSKLVTSGKVTIATVNNKGVDPGTTNVTIKAVDINTSEGSTVEQALSGNKTEHQLLKTKVEQKLPILEAKDLELSTSLEQVNNKVSTIELKLPALDQKDTELQNLIESIDNNTIISGTVTGTKNKKLTLSKKGGESIIINFVDETSEGGGSAPADDIHVKGISFDKGNGALTITTTDTGTYATISVNLDGRYALNSAFTSEVSGIKGAIQGIKSVSDDNKNKITTLTSTVETLSPRVNVLENKTIVDASFSGSNTKTLTINLQNGSPITASFELPEAKKDVHINSIAFNKDTGVLTVGTTDRETQPDLTTEFDGRYTINTDFLEFKNTYYNILNSIDNLVKGGDTSYENANYNIGDYTLTDIGKKLKQDEPVTILIKGSLGAGKTSFDVYNSGSTVNIASIENQENGLYSVKTTWKVSDASNTFVKIFAYPSGQTSTSSIEWIKIVKGHSYSSDFFHSQQDISERLKNIGTVFNLANEGYRHIENNEYEIASYNLSEEGKKLKDRDTVTVIIKGRLGAGKQSFDLYNTELNSINNVVDLNASTIVEDVYFKKTFEWKIPSSGNSNQTLKVCVYPNSVSTSSTIEWVKLVKGKVADLNYITSIDDTLTTYRKLPTKQDSLVSGGNIKTINNQSILGSGNINITSDINQDTLNIDVANVSEEPSIGSQSIKTIINRLYSKLSRINSTLFSGNWNDITNKPTTLQGYGITDAASKNHTHSIDQISSLKNTLDSKASSAHTHTIDDISNLRSSLNNKSSLGHGHTIDDITSLRTELSNKTNVGHIHDDRYARKTHTHSKSEITDFPTSMPASDVSAWAKASTKPSYSVEEIQDLTSLLESKASASHIHMVEDITNIEEKLNEYATKAHTHTEYLNKDFYTGYNTVYSLSNLPISKKHMVANISSPSTLSFSSSSIAEGTEFILTILTTQDFSLPIPNSGNWVSLDGNIIRVKSYKYLEISILFINNKYIISSKVQQ